MARFKRHEACPKCGSRDNLGRYDDGSAWCFGCGYYEKANAWGWKPSEPSERDDGDQFQLSAGLVESTHFPERVTEYLQKYGISPQEAFRNGARFDADRRALAFVYQNIHGQPCCVQERSFAGNPKIPKYLNRGETSDVWCLIGDKGTAVTITEDTLSAIKVGRVCDAFPALGTNFQNWKLLELFKRGYRRVYVWLDSDKWREGREICEKAQWLGMTAKAILTDLDPKSYSDKDILEYLK